MDDIGGFQYLREICGLDRIEVEMKVIGAVDVVAPRVPRVEVDAAEVDDPQQRGKVADYREIDDVSRGVLDGTDLYPLGSRAGRLF